LAVVIKIKISYAITFGVEQSTACEKDIMGNKKSIRQVFFNVGVMREVKKNKVN
jgi:hypothetical protein